MAVTKKTLTLVNDELRLNASEALSGTVVFGLDNQTGSGTYVFECRVRPELNQAGGGWTAFQMVNLATGALVTSATAPGTFRGDASGQLEIRVRCTVAGPGTIDVYGGISLG